MTAQLLASELSTLIQDTKRKSPDVRAAAEKSLADLKGLASTSESQLAADLRRRPEFVRPFLLACRARNAKYAGSSLVSVQRLVAANGLAAEKLDEVLDALRECSELGTDVQLRVLQIMPSLFQRYSDRISESRLTTALQVCFVLQASKNGVISNTAAATLQQVVNDVFTRVNSDRTRSDVASPETTKMSWQAELDCHRVLQDLCLIAEGKQVKSLEKATVSKDFAFELIGTILLNFTSVIPRYTNFVDILRQQLLPLILRIVSSSSPFNNAARAMRLIPPIVKGFVEILPTELEMLMSMLTYLLEPGAAPAWKRVMCLETIREIYREGSNIRRAYALFDQREGHKPIVKEQLDAISRLAAEKPAVIGLGQASSLPQTIEQSGEDLDGMSALQADPLTATTGVSLTTKISTVSGIAVESSSLKVSLIDQLDKAEPPSIPPSYIYALCLTSLNLFCEGVARFILPFATTKLASSRQVRSSRTSSEDDSSADDHRLPTNPLRLEDHRDFLQIKATANLLDACWPAFLSIYSTFFQAALDPDFYHGAIRAFQKLIQAVTLLQLATPRDAFLRAIAKQSLPVAFGQPFTHAQKRPNDGDDEKDPTSMAVPRMSPRNLLCLRALLNLGIALGAVLDTSWPIILSTLQQTDIIIGHISTDRTLSKGGPAIIAPSVTAGGEVSKEFANEVSAVRSAASRMLNSTSELPEEPFLSFLNFLAGQIRGMTLTGQDSSPGTPETAHTRSSSTDHIDSIVNLRANVFVIDAFSQVIEFNSVRFSEDDPTSSGWDQTVECLMRIVVEQSIDVEVRIAAAESICKSVSGATFATADDLARHVSLVAHGLSIIRNMAVKAGMQQHNSSTGHSKVGAEEIHNLCLQTLKACLDQYGQSISDGWGQVCDLILSVFRLDADQLGPVSWRPTPAEPLAPKLLRTSFSSLQSICSDIIDSIPYSCLPKVLRAIYLCSSQTAELNISLTATTLYQSLSDYIWSGEQQIDIADVDLAKPDETDVGPGRLWLHILSALCETSSARQSEIRNSAVHACFRIASGAGDKLRPQDWHICIETVFIRLYQINEAERLRLDETEIISIGIGLDETAASIHKSLCDLIEEYLAVMVADENMPDLWSSLVDVISALLQRHSLVLSTNVFSSLTRILDTAREERLDVSALVAGFWALWTSENPSSHIRLDKPDMSDNQSALSAYVTCGVSLYQISENQYKQKVVQDVVLQIRRSVSESTPTTYVNDLLSPTPLQSECITLLGVVFSTTDTIITPLFLRGAAELIVLPHTTERSSTEHKGPTFVAFANAVLGLLSRCVQERAKSCRLFEEQATVDCFDSMHLIVSRKSTWTRDDRHITVWRSATSVAITAATALIALSRESGFPESSFKLWEAVVSIFDVVLDSGSDASDDIRTLGSDVDFDIEAFNALYRLLVPSLGSAKLSDELRQRFAEAVTLKSLIHEPHPDDSLDPEYQTLWPQPERIGRVSDLPPSRRSKLCYLLVDSLFDLIQSEGKSSENQRLAVAVKPYLQVRTGLVLKAYISDQPLRSRMPCPLSQRKELVHVLHKSIDLVSVGVGGVTRDHVTRSLARSYVDELKSMAIAAMKVTLYDEKIKAIMLQVLEV